MTDDPDARQSAAAAMLAGGVLLSGGNALSHLRAVAIEQGVSMLDGLELEIDRDTGLVKMRGGDGAVHYVREGDVLTIDPAAGRIYAGASDNSRPESRI